MNGYNYILKQLFILFILLNFVIFSSKAFAFKETTHVWIGQQVINDLADDGKITIPFGTTERVFTVKPELVDAILENQEIYRMGNIGPDSVPDIYTGQFVVHPGIDTEWKTDDWLNFLLQSEDITPQKQAFIYGYLGHASADTFAHTYVNQYSGNVFEILKERDNGLSWSDAMVEEFRHFELEKYIATFNPPITDNNGIDLGSPANLISAPTLFLRDKLIFNDEVSLRNEQGGASHLALIHNLRKSLINTGEKEFRQMDIWAVKIVVYNYTGYIISDEDAGKLADLAQKINTFVSEHNSLDEAQAAKQEFIAAIESAVQLDASIQAQLDDAVIVIYSTLVDAIDSANLQRVNIENNIVLASADHAKALADFATENNVHAALTSALNGVNNTLLQEQAKLDQAVLDLANTVSTIERQVCELSCLPHPWPLNEICNDICNVIYDPNPVYVALQSLINTLHSTVANLNSQILDLNNQINQQAIVIATSSALVDSIAVAYTNLNNELNGINNQIVDLNDDLLAARDAKTAATELATTVFLNAINIENDVFNGAVDLVQRATSDINPVRAMLKGWIKDIEDSMLAYIDTSVEVTRQTMIVGDPIKPITEWWDCWGQSLFGVPAPATNTICSVRKRINEITIAMDDFERSMLELTPIGSEVQAFKDKINNEIKALQEEVFYKFLESVTYFPVKELLKLFKEPASDVRLNHYFGTDLSSFGHKGLLELPDMAARVKSDMYASNHEFDPEKYNVIYNAVILAKLSLLDAAGLNEIAGSSLYDENSTTPVNILIGAIRSIDGNHQWMEIAPPYPRRLAYQDGGWPQHRTYGYGEKYNAGGEGLLLWTDCTARNTVFRQIFHGTISPSIESPEVNDFATLLTSPYPGIYPVSLIPHNPFPELASEQVIDKCVVAGTVDPNVNDADKDGLTDEQEIAYGTISFNSDTDNDGMLDGYEIEHGFNPLDSTDALLDADSDGLTNLSEHLYGTDPFNPDTDADGMSDGFEVNYELDVFDNADAALDADGDLLINLGEYQNNTNPLNPDTDNDGIQDNYEVEQGLNPLIDDTLLDLDGDGLTNGEEYLLGSAANNNDSDGDGLPDGFEQKITGLDILINDAAADLDNDGVSNIDEFVAGTDLTGVSDNPLVNLIAKTSGSKKLTLSWNLVTNVDRYNIYWSENPGVSKTNGNKIANVSNPFEHTDLVNRKNYYYVVTAENSYGESPESAEIKSHPDDFAWLIPILNIILD